MHSRATHPEHAAAHEEDETPTPRESGARAVMSYTCRLSITKLSQHLTDVPRRSAEDLEETRQLLARAEQLATAIEGWHVSEPSADHKRLMIIEVLALRASIAALTRESGS